MLFEPHVQTVPLRLPSVFSAALWFFYHTLGWNHLLGAALATQVSTAWNFALVDTVVYRKRAHGTRAGRAARFFAMSRARGSSSTS